MSGFRTVTDRFAISSQISAADVAEAARQGFTLILNNRPDGEAPDQPPAASLAAAARAAGVDYVDLPIVGRPTPEQADRTARALAGQGKVLAFCRTGNRSIMAWALAQATTGAMSRDELLRAGAAAGYDLSAILPR
jgi:uncharacterized protein (TIGR01244 family)